MALQLRVIWGIWSYKDLTKGDTSGYFVYAAGWANHLQDDIVWSPLYTNFWGTILALVNNVYDAAMIHRVAIVLAAAVLVLALARRLLNPAVALIIAAWWAIVPANFNVLYEVHLFGVLPILFAAWIVARSPGRTALGISLAVLTGTTLLLRNEMVIATIILAVAIAFRERRIRKQQTVPRAAYLTAYAVPLAVVCLLTAGSYWRSGVQGHRLSSDFHVKQGLNLCQVYAFNFQQRHPDRFRGNAFTECEPLMRQTFGKPTPTLIEATTANPRAVAAMMTWNLRLSASGLQVALFNATATGDQPDYIPVDAHRSYAAILSVLLIALLLAGGWAVRREFEYWREWVAPRLWGFVVLGAVAATTIVVVLTERPRPEYMYGLTVGIMIVTGVCVTAVLRRANAMRFAAPAAITLTLALIVAVPSYYHMEPRPLYEAVRRLRPVRATLQRPGSILVASELGGEICFYLAGSFDRECTSPAWPPLQSLLAGGARVRMLLDQTRATVIYAGPGLLSDPSVAKLVASPGRYGWRQVAGGVGEDGPWRVLVRSG